jgi:hypothetical protein
MLTKEERETRDKELCAFYQTSYDIEACVIRFKLKRQRIYQILKEAKVRRPPTTSSRTEFLGVNVKKETKHKLRAKASNAGVSVSQLASDALDTLVEK